MLISMWLAHANSVMNYFDMFFFFFWSFCIFFFFLICVIEFDHWADTFQTFHSCSGIIHTRNKKKRRRRNRWRTLNLKPNPESIFHVGCNFRENCISFNLYLFFLVKSVRYLFIFFFNRFFSSHFILKATKLTLPLSILEIKNFQMIM